MSEEGSASPQAKTWFGAIPGWLQGLAAVVGALAALIGALAAAGAFKGQDGEVTPKELAAPTNKIHPPVDFKYRAIPYAGNTFIKLRAQPSYQAKEVGFLSTDGIVLAGDAVGDWRPVLIPNGTEGWVQANAITIVQ